ncbi:MAG: GGDEF domain-containing protein [Coriobacteriia bacterium]
MPDAAEHTHAEPPPVAAGRVSPALTVSERAYFVGRVAIVVTLVSMFVPGIIDFPGWLEGQLFAGGLGLFAITTAVGLCVVFASSMRLASVMMVVLPFDLVTLGVLTWATYEHGDPMYPVVLALPLVYAWVLRTRSAWTISGVVAVTYLFALLLAHAAGSTLDDVLFVALKGVSILAFGLVVAVGVERQDLRRRELEESSRHIAGLNERLNRRLAELHAVSEITEVIHSTLDFESVGPLVLDILQKVIDMPACALFVIDKQKGLTLFSASQGVQTAEVPASGLGVEPYLDLAAMEAESSGGHFSCASLLEHNQMMVVFCAESERIDGMTDEDRLVLQAVASELAVAVENSQLYKLTKRLSITDELTGLYNYRFLQQRLDQEVERTRRYGKDLSFLMIDVDDFKAYNDTFGHVAGDKALEELGEVLRTSVREVDIVARYGGEEFSVLLPETDASGAFVVAEKVREAVEQHGFVDVDGARTVRLTISVGLASYPVHGEDRESLLREADEALYQAKTTGKDRVRSPRVAAAVSHDDEEETT